MDKVGYGKRKRKTIKGKGILDYVKKNHLLSRGLEYAGNLLAGTKYAALAPVASAVGSYAKSKGWGKKRKMMMAGGGMGDGIGRMEVLTASLRSQQ